MRTTTLNTYKVTFHLTVEVEAVHEDDAPVLAGSDLERMITDGEVSFDPRDMAYTVELIDGIEPGQDD